MSILLEKRSTSSIQRRWPKQTPATIFPPHIVTYIRAYWSRARGRDVSWRFNSSMSKHIYRRKELVRYSGSCTHNPFACWSNYWVYIFIIGQKGTNIIAMSFAGFRYYRRDWLPVPTHPYSLYALTRRQNLCLVACLCKGKATPAGAAQAKMYPHIACTHTQKCPLSNVPRSHQPGHVHSPNQSNCMHIVNSFCLFLSYC